MNTEFENFELRHHRKLLCLSYCDRLSMDNRCIEEVQYGVHLPSSKEFFDGKFLICDMPNRSYSYPINEWIKSVLAGDTFKLNMLFSKSILCDDLVLPMIDLRNLASDNVVVNIKAILAESQETIRITPHRMKYAIASLSRAIDYLNSEDQSKQNSFEYKCELSEPYKQISTTSEPLSDQKLGNICTRLFDTLMDMFSTSDGLVKPYYLDIQESYNLTKDERLSKIHNEIISTFLEKN